MENPSTQHSKSTRRKLLTTFGSIGIATLGTSATPSPEKKGDSTWRLYGSVAEMMADHSLKAGMYVRTAGFTAAGDHGASDYLITNQNPSGATSAALMALPASGLFAQMLDQGYVNYRMFGAQGNAQQDDGPALLEAHSYANARQIPVINHSGAFWIKQTRRIPIQTDTLWGTTVFHVDEQYNSKAESCFEIQSSGEPQDIVLTPEQKTSFLKQLKPGVRIIPELAAFKNCLVVIQDENDRIGVRQGQQYNGHSWAREELFYVEEHGCIIGDIAWSFQNYTRLKAHPANEHYLTLEGGTFYLSGDSPGKQFDPYRQGGLAINRSRTIIRNQWVGLEKNRDDQSLAPRSGFYSFNHVYDVLLENIRLIPWEQDREGTDRDVKAGTYGIGGSRIMNATFRNITAEGGAVHWGVFGTNLNKNLRVESCKLNRIDVHFHCWNIFIKDSEIGYRGITLTGGGQLTVENTKCYNNHFIQFRQDYGAKWDGAIRIHNCSLVPASNAECTLLTFTPSNFNYRYPIVFGRQIEIENFTIDFSNAPESPATCWLLKLARFAKMNDGTRIAFPRRVEFRNIQVVGREKGVSIMEIFDAGSYQTTTEGSYDSNYLNTNSLILLDTIHLSPSPQHHLLFTSEKDKKYTDRFSLYPEFQINACKNLHVNFGDSIATIRITNSLVARIASNTDRLFQGSFSFTDCTFQAQAEDVTTDFYTLGSELGTSLSNCQVLAPLVKGTPRPDLTNQTGIIRINQAVRFNQLNTRLGKDILRFCKEQGLSLNPRFIDLLKCHHELEPETI